MIIYKKIFITVVLSFILFSCSSPSFKVLDANVQNGIIMEGLYWRGFFDPNGGFQLRLTNNSNAVLTNCELIFDDKFKHTLDGLYSQEKGLIKNGNVQKGEQLTLQFDHDLSNLLYFNIEDKNYFPKTIKLTYDSGSVLWNLK
jgi:hypothetical protein